MGFCKDCIHNDVYIIHYDESVLNSCDYFKDNSKFIELPCPIGTDLYRIDSRTIPCHRGKRERDEYSCQNFLNCCLEDECDLGKEYYIFEMKNANAMTILGNQKYLGSLVFTSKEEAEKRLEELK